MKIAEFLGQYYGDKSTRNFCFFPDITEKIRNIENSFTFFIFIEEIFKERSKIKGTFLHVTFLLSLDYFYTFTILRFDFNNHHQPFNKSSYARLTTEIVRKI